MSETQPMVEENRKPLGAIFVAAVLALVVGWLRVALFLSIDARRVSTVFWSIE